MQLPLKSVVKTLLVVCVVLAFGCSGEQAPPSQAPVPSASTLSVCELLANLPRYRNHVVTVTGIYWQGLRQTCASPLVTAGHTWPSAINLVTSEMVDTAVGFKTDQDSWDRLDRAVIKAATDRRLGEIWTSVTGLVRAPAAFVQKDSGIVGGYGHLGVFPAELVVRRIEDITPKATPTYDYGSVMRGSRHQ